MLENGGAVITLNGHILNPDIVFSGSRDFGVLEFFIKVECFMDQCEFLNIGIN